MNRLCRNIAEICRELPLDEKWLIVPSYRIGYQWLEIITRSGCPVVNLRMKTLRRVVLDLASSGIAEKNLRFLSGLEGEILIDRIFCRLKSDSGYMLSLDGGPELSRMIFRSISDLRLAGVGPGGIQKKKFEVSEKADELALLMREYLGELEGANLIDYAGALAIAAGKLKKSGKMFDDVRVLIPSEIMSGIRALEKELIENIPGGKKEFLDYDEPLDKKSKGFKPENDTALLSFLPSPGAAPKPLGDGTARIFHAVGEVNEVREVLRRILENGHSLDDVEIIHTDVETYVPIIYETLHRVAGGSGRYDLGVPVTFSEGIPCRYSRPGRALAAWIRWIAGDYPQTVLLRMIREGLLNVTEDEKPLFSRVVAVLRCVFIGFGRDRYEKKLQEHVNELKKKLKNAEDDEKKKSIRAKLDSASDVLDFVRKFMDSLPGKNADQVDMLDCAKTFIEKFARTKNRLDEYAKRIMLEEIEDMTRILAGGGETSIDIREWLSDLPGELMVHARGPEQGCLYVSGIRNGGHSGRKHLFVVGLDDMRFPGAGLQDPLVLDSEREKLSKNLSRAADSRGRKIADFYRLLARRRGNITLSFSLRDLVDERELFPGQVLISAYRILSGEREGDQSAFLKWLGRPCSFAPEREACALDESEWWLWKLCGPDHVKNPARAVLARFPNLAQGGKAQKARESREFTEYDGRIDEGLDEISPFNNREIPMSPSRLEMVGRCPLSYFFRHVLRIEPPGDLEVDREEWLGPLGKGEVLHTAFYRLMNELRKKKKLPARFDRDFGRLNEILDEEIENKKQEIPSPGEAVVRSECMDLKLIGRIFLTEEAKRPKECVPVLLEASTSAAQPFSLGDREIWIRGRIDRVDRTGDGYFVWDYKTGSDSKYKEGDPFRCGRVLQPALYPEIARLHLAEMGNEGWHLEGFGFFFPGTRARGRSVEYKPEDLSGGKKVVELLCEIIAQGAFIASDYYENDIYNDCGYCDYDAICRDAAALAEANRKKVENTENEKLEAFRELRKSEREEE
ncbi:MAG: PD-(D/E)XK nuclease family protein [Planctomycetota bacterium]|nr:MAG: PD-(D/E)XK nuclease family protein [Planctomycetota bacterium]